MITHVVIFTWNDGVTAAQVDGVRQALDRMAGDLGHLATISHGPDLVLRAGNGDYALVARFATVDDWHRYQAEPRHKDVVATHIVPIQASRLTAQFETAGASDD